LAENLINWARISQNKSSLPQSVTLPVYNKLKELYGHSSTIWIEAGCGTTAPDNAAIANLSSFKATKGKKTSAPFLTRTLVALVSDLPKFKDTDKDLVLKLRQAVSECASGSGQLWILVGTSVPKPSSAHKVKNLNKIK